MANRYYWLKLKRDFFKRNEIKVIEAMPNGKDYILFYLKLLCESVDHEGNLRFSERIPYSEEMLSTITNTNVDIVRSAIKIFTELQMMEILDDGTYFMGEVQKMIGSAADNDNARRQQRFRERKKAENVALLEENVTKNNASVTASVTKNNESIEKELEIDKEKDIEKKKDNTIVLSKKEKSTKRFTPPTVEEVRSYCSERMNRIDAEYFCDYYTARGWMVGKDKMKDWKAAVRTWERNDQERFKQEQKEKQNKGWKFDQL